MSSTSKLWMALLAAVVVWALARERRVRAGRRRRSRPATRGAGSPTAVTVPTGATVRWEFDQATAAAHGHLDERQLDQERVARRRAAPRSSTPFDAPGTYTFRCNLHGGMTGTVTVEADEPLRRPRLLPHHRLPPRDRDRRRPHRHPADGRRPRTSTSSSARTRRCFTDAGLRPYEVVVFLNTDGEGILNGAQRTAFERWTQRGGGIVSIHADANADRNWAWKGDMMGGAWFLNHPAPPVQFQQATVNVVDTTHPATRDLPQPNWVRDGRVVQLHRRAGERPRPAQARREHLRRAGRLGGRRRPPDRVVLELRRRAPLLHRARPRGRVLVEPDYLDHIRGAIEWAAGEEAGRLRARPRGPADRRVVRQGHARRHDREPDGDRGRRRRRRLLRRARPARSSTTTAPPARCRTIAHDPGPPRQRERPARDHARPDFDTNRCLYLFYSAPIARGCSASRASRSRPTARSTWRRAAAARVPAPADHLLPLVRLDDLRARRQPLHLDRRRHAARRVAGLQPDRRPAGQRAGRQPGRRPRA